MASETESLAPPSARPHPVLATAGYAVVYLAFAVAGGALVASASGGPSALLTVLVTAVVSVSTALSLLFVLQACRIPMGAGAEAMLLLPTVLDWSAPEPKAVLLFVLLAAVPVPVPTPVAVNMVPGLLFAAPIRVKSVVPALWMV